MNNGCSPSSSQPVSCAAQWIADRFLGTELDARATGEQRSHRLRRIGTARMGGRPPLRSDGVRADAQRVIGVVCSGLGHRFDLGRHTKNVTL
jgi:hypothetical protein